MFDSSESGAAQYYGLYKEYLLYASFQPGSGDAGTIATDGLSGHFGQAAVGGQPTFTTQAPSAAQEVANPAAWLDYLAQYQQYASELIAWMNAKSPDGIHPNSQFYNFQWSRWRRRQQC